MPSRDTKKSIHHSRPHYPTYTDGPFWPAGALSPYLKKLSRDKPAFQTEKSPVFSESDYPFSYEIYQVWWTSANSVLLMQQMCFQSISVLGCTMPPINPGNREPAESLHWRNWNRVSIRCCHQGLYVLADKLFWGKFPEIMCQQSLEVSVKVTATRSVAVSCSVLTYQSHSQCGAIPW